MSRLPPFDIEKLDAEQRAVADAIVAGPRGGLRGPFQAWLASPKLAERAQLLGEHCRFGTELPDDVRELAIILAGKHWGAQFEFWAHARLARQVGLPEAVIEAVRTGQRPTFERDDLQVAYDLATESLEAHRVSDTTFARAISTFGDRGVVDLIGTVGYYSLVSMTLNAFEVEVPEGETNPLD
ncbi:MAG: carboxymuconolactone decarboxylase family protein [Dehalococcoidia bacterium]